MTDREQRRAAEANEDYLALLDRLRQAERKIVQLSEWYNAEDRKTRELKARLAKADKLVEALRAVARREPYMYRLTNEALAEWEQG